MGAIRIQHLALGIALTAIATGCSSLHPPVVIKVVRIIDNSETISADDYERLREITEDAIDHVKSIDPTIRPQLSLASQKNFIKEIEDQTESGFGPDILITDSDTALELHKRKLVDPIQLAVKDRDDTPDYLTIIDVSIMGECCDFRYPKLYVSISIINDFISKSGVI